jgi:hypothetical protein
MYEIGAGAVKRMLADLFGHVAIEVTSAASLHVLSIQLTLLY